MDQKFSIAIEKDMSKKAPGYRDQITRLTSDGRFDVRFLENAGPAPDDVLSPDELRDVDMLILMGKRRIESSSLEGLERLKWIGRFGAGFDTVNMAACSEHGVILSNAPYGIRQPVAELVMAYIFAQTTRLIFFDRYIRDKGFTDKADYVTRCVGGQTLGLIGSGGIAECLVGLIQPLEMKVIAYDPYADASAMRQKGIELVDLEQVLKSSDFVSVHVPLTEETRGMLSEQHFRMMKPTAHFINTSRGGIYSDAVLAGVLNDGAIAGASIDVFEGEPDVDGNPLLSCERAIVTPHTAGASNNIDAIRMTMESLVDSVFSIADGQLPGSILNPEAVGGKVPAEKLSPSFNPR